MKAKYLILTFLLLAAAKTFAQQVKFTVSVDKNPVGMADTLLVTFAINAAGEQFNRSDFSHFRLIDESEDDLKINGKLSRSFKYRLVPLMEGEYVIGPASIAVDGNTVATTPLKIKVVNGPSVSALTAEEERAVKFQQRIEKINEEKTSGSNANLNHEKFLVSAEAVKSDTAGVFKLRFSIKANAGNFSAPDLKDFEMISGPDQTASMQIINGRQTAGTVVEYKLKALKDGEFTIGYASIKVNSIRIATAPIKIVIKNGALVESASR